MPTRRHPSPRGVIGSRPGLAAVVAALAILVMLSIAPRAEAASARVAADGDCLNMRQAPSLSGQVITCVDDGVVVTTIPGEVTADGLAWQQVRTPAAVGWVAARYLVVLADADVEGEAVAPASPLTTTAPSALPILPTAPTAPTAYEVPPPGGMTLGLAGTASPEAVAAAQTFEVAGVSAFDPETQRYLTYIPGAPAIVNTLDADTLRPEMVVMVRRAGTLPPADTSPVAAAGTPAVTVGTPTRFATPSRDGLTLGVAGTNDPAAIVRAQRFTVDVVMTLEVASPHWLTYIPGAPEWLNTLNAATLRPTSILFVRRSATAPDPPPPDLRTVPITYYYCAPTDTGIGDGGGFCGTMSSGQVVHPGAASCDRAYRGQRFRVVGDPGDLVYTCLDTGGAVIGEHRDIWFATSGAGLAWWKLVAPTGFASIEVLPEDEAAP